MNFEAMLNHLSIWDVLMLVFSCSDIMMDIVTFVEDVGTKSI